MYKANVNDSVRIEPFGSAGFAVTYPDCSPDTVETIRDYQLQVRNSQGWMSRLDFMPEGGCRVSVFPLNDLPKVVLSGSGWRAW